MSLLIWQKIAERRIQEAQDQGDLKDLPGKGKPLELADDSRIPEELRLAYKVLKNAGYTPPEVEAKKEITRIEEMLANAPDEKSRYQAIKRLNFLTMKLGSLRPQSTALDEHEYAHKLVDRLVKKDES